MVFKKQKPEDLSWKPVVLPPEGQEQGALAGQCWQETKQRHAVGRRALAPAQDAPTRRQRRRSPSGRGVAPSCHRLRLQPPNI